MTHTFSPCLIRNSPIAIFTRRIAIAEDCNPWRYTIAHMHCNSWSKYMAILEIFSRIASNSNKDYCSFEPFGSSTSTASHRNNYFLPTSFSSSGVLNLKYYIANRSQSVFSSQYVQRFGTIWESTRCEFRKRP